MFVVNQLVWVRTKLYPLWPCVTLQIPTKYNDNQFYYEVRFLGEDSTATIVQRDISDFDINRPEFKPSPQILKKFKYLRSGLQLAAKRVQKQKEGKKQKPRIKVEGQYFKNQLQWSKSKKQKKFQRQKRDRIQKQELHSRNRKNISKYKSVHVEKQEIRKDPSENKIQQQLQSQNESKNKGGTNIIDLSILSPILKRQIEESRLSIVEQIPAAESIAAQSIPAQEYNSSLEQEQNPLPKAQKSIASGPPSLSLKSRLPSRPCPSEQLQLKKASKQKQRLIAQQKSLKTFSVEKQSRSHASKRLLDIKFILDTLTFLLFNSNPDETLVQNNLNQLIKIFYIDDVAIEQLINLRVNALLVFVKTKLPKVFKEEVKWFQKRIKNINQKIIKDVNDIDYLHALQKLNKNQPEVIPQAEQFQQEFQQQLSQTMTKNQTQVKLLYKFHIRRLIQKCIKQNTTQQQQLHIIKVIIKFLNQNLNNIHRVWTAIKQKIKKQNYQTGADCLAGITEYIDDLS